MSSLLSGHPLRQIVHLSEGIKTQRNRVYKNCRGPRQTGGYQTRLKLTTNERILNNKLQFTVKGPRSIKVEQQTRT